MMDLFKNKPSIAKKTILIIDDEEDFCYFVKLNLEETGNFDVITATSGVEGIKKATTFQPDMILLDIIMPKMTGTQVAEELLNNKSTKDIPIIFVTAIAKRSEVGRRDEKIGGRLFMFKPVKFDDLIAEISSQLK
jgi:CheY-like chemotaxis protein